MTHLRIHLIYIAIIAFLAFQYWTKTEALDNAIKSIEQMDKLLKINNEVVDKSATTIFNDIQKNVMAYANNTNIAFLEKAKKAMSVSVSLIKWLDTQKLEIINMSGGFDKTDSTILANRLSTKGSNTFFSNQKIQEIKDSLTHYQHILTDSLDKNALANLQKQFSTFTLVSKDAYWQNLKNGTAANVLAQLTAIQNHIKLDIVPYFYYISNYMQSGGLIFDAFRLAIAPQKAAIIEGEKFKADVYLAQYSSNPGPDVKFFVNNQEVEINQGVGHFEKTQTTIGKKTVKVEAHIQNPLTGQIVTRIGEFEYEVLPKCSKNCQ